MSIQGEPPNQPRCGCAESQRYPLDLRSEQYLKSNLRKLHDMLQAESPRLFNPSSSDVRFLETYEGDSKCQLKKINDAEKLRQAICLPNSHQSREPLSRYVFIQAPSSRHRLNCTLDMFQLVGSHHQVSPIFLDLLISFGAQDSPQDFHHTYFREESHYHQASTAVDGGSNGAVNSARREIKLCYKFQALEKKSGYKLLTPRQTAVYHSYDFSTGKSFWITTKANTVIQQRVIEESEQGVPLEAAMSGDRGLAFATTLKMHLINVEWSSEGWRWFIHDTEKILRKILFKKEESAPIGPLSQIGGWVEELTLPSRTFHRGDQNNRTSTKKPIGLSRTLSEISKITPWRAGNKHKFSHPYKRIATDEIYSANLNLEDLEEILQSTQRDFSIEKLQNTNIHRNQLEEYKLAIELNIRNMVDLRQFYQRLYDSPDFPDDVHASCANAFIAFQSHIRSIERLLEGECLQIEALISLIGQNQKLRDQIMRWEDAQLFHTVSQINHLVSRNSQQVSIRMEEMAQRAEKDTRSMHIITLFTLIFLPGTFLASFFSTPIFGTGDNSSGWTFHTDLFALFAKIMVPMTFAVVCIWRIYMWLKEREGRTRKAQATEPGAAQV